jgi:hypothetical protein
MEVSIICTAASRPDTTNSRPTIWRSSQTSAAGSLQQTESLFAENHEHFFNAIDPTETWAAQEFCSAKALFVPSLKRDIVLSVGMHTTSGGGIAWQSTSYGENSYSHWAAQQLRGRSRR